MPAVATVTVPPEELTVTLDVPLEMEELVPPAKAKVPDVLGIVMFTVTASVGIKVVEPDVAPLSTTDPIFNP